MHLTSNKMEDENETFTAIYIICIMHVVAVSAHKIVEVESCSFVAGNNYDQSYHHVEFFLILNEQLLELI